MSRRTISLWENPLLTKLTLMTWSHLAGVLTWGTESSVQWHYDSRQVSVSLFYFTIRQMENSNESTIKWTFLRHVKIEKHQSVRSFPTVTDISKGSRTLQTDIKNTQVLTELPQLNLKLLLQHRIIWCDISLRPKGSFFVFSLFLLQTGQRPTLEGITVVCALKCSLTAWQELCRYDSTS